MQIGEIKARPVRVFALKSRDIFLKEILKLFVGEHGIDDLEYGATVVLVQLVDEFDALKFRFILQCHFAGQLPFLVQDLIYGHIKKPGQ